MTFVRVELMVDDQSYSVEIDDKAPAQSLIDSFVESLGLSSDVKYELLLVNALQIREGAKLRLVKAKTQYHRGLKRIE